ncbi:sugar nucleotide-binding protein [Nostocoides sp. F2B08]|uniref:sugar nucleotide-binding protein n=1 Tax=Nostocoides sp. F2B08 TaxID=2653936 RepID=UPI001263102A|nr:sugar nucleotide-binding protein [Tetrasphaera sp. F2B08]KAB7744824.1 sugar nucleotide-binding protein [Tetrasphaera sp. F2B08]
MAELTVERTAIDGLLVVRLPVHGDARGWFKENWQRAKSVPLGVPDFGPVQENMSHNVEPGVTRGFHAEPWDKYVSVAAGRVFGAWVDLREGDGFGTLVTTEIDPGLAVFVPRGVANAYQALDPDSTYAYLVNDHWSPEARDRYTFVNLADETIACPWPIPLSEATLSEADENHPRLDAITPLPRHGRTIVVGGDGQLGRALRAVFPEAEFLSRSELDIASAESVAAFDFDHVDTIVNAAAWTAVDAAETPEGRVGCWRTNVEGVGRLVEVARRHRATLVHVSSDYVFDGTREVHSEDEPFSPLGVYGASKAAGDALVATWERHYIVRTSWVIGEGPNFVRTMVDLARRGISPTVVDDQYGRLTFADDLADAIAHLVRTSANFGSYNVTNDGPTQSWFDIAARIFELVGAEGSVSPVSTEEYASGKSLAPRPRHSTLELDKIRSAGLVASPMSPRLTEYVGGLLRPWGITLGHSSQP